MFLKKHWFRKKKNKRENSFRRNEVLLSKENLYCEDMHKREYSDSELSCNHVNPTVEDENTVWKVRRSQGESSQYLKSQCQAFIMKVTVICGPEIKVRPLPPLPKPTDSSVMYDYVDREFWSDKGRKSNDGNHYEKRLQIFKEMIISNVDVRQILSHLTFVEYPQKYRSILTNRSNRDAMTSLIDDIEKSEELGRWKQLVEALERCGYEYISRCLRGRSVIDKRYQKEFLKIMSVTVRKQIVPTELTAYLWNADVINDEDKQRIDCQQTLQGEIAAADLLLEILPTKNDNWYKLFIEALRHAEMNDVANVLDLPELHEGQTGPKIISTRTDAEYSPASSMQEATERIQCDTSNIETNPDSDTTALKSTSPDDVNEQDTKMNYENKDSSNMDTMEKELYTWSSWAYTKSVPAKVLDKVPIPLTGGMEEYDEETYTCYLSLPERTPVDALKLNDTTYAATDCDDECYKEDESPDLQVFDKVPISLTGGMEEYDDETCTCYPLLPKRTPVDALKLNDTTDTATDCADDSYEEVESPDVQDTVDQEVCTHGSLNEFLDIPPIANAFKKTEGSREKNVRNAKCTRQLSSSHLLKDTLTLDDVIHADWKTVKEEKDRLLEAKRLAKEELEQLKAVVNLKNNISEIQCQKIKLAKDFASADERFKLHRESIKGVQGGNFDHFQPESEYLSEGLYSAEHMLRNRMENTSRDLPHQFEIYRARSTSRKSWQSRASLYKDSAIYECTNLATVEEDT